MSKSENIKGTSNIDKKIEKESSYSSLGSNLLMSRSTSRSTVSGSNPQSVAYTTRRTPTGSHHSTNRSPNSGRRSALSSRTTEIPPNPYLDLTNQWLDSNPLIPAGISIANIRRYYVPVYDENREVHLVCSRGVACDRNLIIDGQKVTCRDGSSRCRRNHYRMCRYAISGNRCRFHERGTCELPHYTLWSPPQVIDTTQFPELSLPGSFAQSSSCSCADIECEHSTSTSTSTSTSAPAPIDFLKVAKASAHLPEPKPAPKPISVKRAKPGNFTQLCKCSKEECKHAKRGRCTFAHSLDELVLVPEVQQLMNILDNPGKYQGVFQQIADEIYRVLSSREIERFIEKDKGTAHKAHELPFSTNLKETLEMWKIYASRARQMKSGKLPPPVGFSIDEIPDFTLFPEDGFENQKEAIVWTLANNQYQCEK